MNPSVHLLSNVQSMSLPKPCNWDPIELRRRIEPETDPTSGNAFSSRHLVDAYAQGAERFGWGERNPVPAVPARG